MKKTSSGFTIVELLIVIVVIGILAAITIVAYNGIQQRAIISTLKSDLTNASKLIELSNVDGGAYPTSLPSGVKASQNVTLSLSQASSGYCINAESTTNPLRWSYNSASGGLQEGLCSGAVISGSETGMNANLISDTNFTQTGTTWLISRGSSTAIIGSTRTGISSDPYSSRPVLTLTNTPASAATYAFLRGPVNATSINSGKTYMLKYYVRLASGTHTGSISYFGVLNSDGTNVAISHAANAVTPTSAWQQTSRIVTASQNGISNNMIYLPLNLTDAKTNTFTLEFQGFELREQ